MKKKLTIIALLLVSLSTGVGCSDINVETNIGDMQLDKEIFGDNPILYEDEILRLSLIFPESWTDKYIIESYQNTSEWYDNLGFTIWNKEIREQDGGGMVVTVSREIGDLITEENVDMVMPSRGGILTQGNGYTYLWSMAGDVQWPVDSDRLAAEFESMTAEFEKYITETAKVIGDSRPVAVNKGYQVIGTDYFTVEVPNGWNATTEQNYTLLLHLKNENGAIAGTIEMLPYGADVMPIIPSDMHKQVLYEDEENKRAMMITVNCTDQVKAQNAAVIADIMADSLIYKGGAYNLIDMETAKNGYLSWSNSETVFGQIESFEKIDGRITGINFKVMSFVADDTAGNGFRIDDLNKTETYSIDYSIDIAPLTNGGYSSTLGFSYIMNIIDFEVVFNSDETCYEDCYYDLIAVNREAKMIFGHYIP